jgi:protein EFR3
MEMNSTGPPAATPSDYTLLLNILTNLHERLPGRALITGVPMLLALHVYTSQMSASDPHATERRHAIRELTAKLWLVIGKVWESDEITKSAEKVFYMSPCKDYG